MDVQAFIENRLLARSSPGQELCNTGNYQHIEVAGDNYVAGAKLMQMRKHDSARSENIESASAKVRILRQAEINIVPAWGILRDHVAALKHSRAHFKAGTKK
jgi:hypothetical protein